MRLLLVHNYYSKLAPSGENGVFELESRLLRDAGHEVQQVTVSNDDVGAGSFRQLFVRGLLAPWSPSGRQKVRAAAKSYQPDVIHVHNTFPILSPSVFYAARTLNPKPAVVMTAHNYRMFCAAGNCMRNGSLCTQCIDTRSSIYSLLHGCYRESRISTMPVAVMIGLHNALNTYRKCIDYVIAQTSFQKEILVNAARFPSSKVAVIPHCVVPTLQPLPWEERENRVVFIGRLSPQKGMEVLLQVWEKMGRSAPELVIIGSGRQEDEYRARCRERGLDGTIRFLGFVSENLKWDQLRRCKLLIMPTQWYETFGLVLAEAFAMGVPVLASNIGCIPLVVKDGADGLLVEPSKTDQWIEALQYLLPNDALLRHMSECAYSRYLKEYSAAGHLRQVEDFYRHAAESAQGLAVVKRDGRVAAARI